MVSGPMLGLCMPSGCRWVGGGPIECAASLSPVVGDDTFPDGEDLEELMAASLLDVPSGVVGVEAEAAGIDMRREPSCDFGASTGLLTKLCEVARVWYGDAMEAERLCCCCCCCCC